jgi:hypothetical protein
MANEIKQKEIIEMFEELEKKAREIYPNLDEEIETFNSMRVEQESYLNYLALINEHPLPIASNQANIE